VVDALACVERALAINPDHAAAQLNLCATLYELHVADRGAAAAQAARLLEAHGHRPLIRRGLAGIVGEDIDERYDGLYAKALFDDFSRTFDRTLTALGYSPRAIAQALAIDANQRLDILDAGCGTGLAGPLFKPVARSLVGLDLSPGMLEQARALSIYDRLVCTDAAAFMARHPDAFDLIVAADVLTYIGELPRFLDAAHRALRSDGRLAVSVENLDRDGQTEGYRLAASGRYKHSRRCLEQAFGVAGFTIGTIAENSMRREHDDTIQAWIVLAEKRR
jgi:predicted TPR repeat methyltransferase